MDHARRPERLTSLASRTSCAVTSRTSPTVGASRRKATRTALVVDAIAQQLAVRNQHDPDSFIFSGVRGGPLRYSTFHSRSWTPAVKAAGLGHITMHGLRHSPAGLVIEQRALPTMMGRLGHSTIGVTMNTCGDLIPAVDDGLAQAMEAHFTTFVVQTWCRRRTVHRPEPTRSPLDLRLCP